MLQCWIYDEKRRPNFQEILQKINKFLSHPKTLTEEVEMIDISGPLLSPTAPNTGLEGVPNIDAWLDMVQNGKYDRSLYDQEISNLESRNNITTR